MSVRSALRVPARMLVDSLREVRGLFDLRSLRSPQGGEGRRTIAFQAFALHLAQMLRPIMEALRDEAPDVEIHFVLAPHPHVPRSELRRLREFARSCLALPDARIHAYDRVLWRRFDLVVCADSYARFPLRTPRRAIVLHGPVLGRRAFERWGWRKPLSDFDLVLVNGEYDRRLVRERCAPGPSGWVQAAGLPFFDALEKPRFSREEYLARLGLDPERTTVLVAPHWSPLAAGGTPPERLVDDAVGALRELDVNVIVKPHAWSLLRNGRVGGRSEPRAGAATLRWDRDPDDRPALAHADLLVSDHSSRAFAFMLLRKPVVACLPSAEGLDALAARRLEMLRRGAFVVRRADEIADFVRRPAAWGAVAERGSAVARECYSHVGSSTAEVVGHLRRALAS